MIGSGTTYGFMLQRPTLQSGGGGGTGEQQRWDTVQHTQTAAFTTGSLVIPLNFTPVDPDGIQVFSQTMPLFPDDYTVLSGPSRIQIDFEGDPATDTETGEWLFLIRYPYLL